MVSWVNPDDSSPPRAEDKLRRIQTLTDAALAHLDSEQLLDELLERIRELVDADTAAILLLDHDTRDLVATAAKGIEEEVRQGVRIPLGAGFAGRIAASGQTIYLEEVDHTNVLNPILREKGIRSLLGAPLIANGSVIGVVHVGTLRPRRFTDDEVELLQLVGDRAALAISARRSSEARLVAATLQRSLLPGRLPSISEVRFAARYIAGELGLGGDWYDVLPFSPDRVGVAIGDVVGHGVKAAVVMGRLRSALRAYALDTGSPAEVLTRLDMMVQKLEPDVMATLLYGVFDRRSGELVFATAGHLPPVLALVGGAAELVDVQPDPPIGINWSGTRENYSVEIPCGATLYLYTDGLVERRSESIQEGLERLCGAATAGLPDAGCTQILEALIGSSSPDDDLAMLALHRAVDDERPLRLVVPATASVLADVRAELRRWLVGVGASADEVTDLLVSSNEACTNAVEHAYGAHEGLITIDARVDGPDVVVSVTDSGAWRPPRGEGRGRGRGLFIMRRLVDDMQLERGDEGTRVVLRHGLGGGGDKMTEASFNTAHEGRSVF